MTWITVYAALSAVSLFVIVVARLAIAFLDRRTEEHGGTAPDDVASTFAQVCRDVKVTYLAFGVFLTSCLGLFLFGGSDLTRLIVYGVLWSLGLVLYVMATSAQRWTKQRIEKAFWEPAYVARLELRLADHVRVRMFGAGILLTAFVGFARAALGFLGWV